MDVLSEFDNYVYEFEDMFGNLLEFMEEDQVVAVSKKFTELRTLLTCWEHDYLTRIRTAVKGRG